MRTSTFKQNINSVLRDNAINRYISGRKKGKIDFNSLYKISNSNKVFKQKEERKGKDYSVTFLVDISMSMQGRIKVIASIVEELSMCFMQLSMPTSVYLFSDDVYSIQSNSKKLSEDIMKTYRIYNGGTQDAYALHVVGNEICKKNAKNILIVFTDGEGTDYTGLPVDVYRKNRIDLAKLKNAKTVVKGLHKKYQDLEIICISIGSPNAYRVYGNQRTKLIESATEAQKATVQLLKKVIKRD